MRSFYSAWMKGGRCTTYEIGLLNPSNKFDKITIERWNELVKLPLTLAVKAAKTGEIYLDGNAHGDVRLKHDLGNKEFIRGFVHDNGMFMTAEEAQAFVKMKTGYTTSDETLMSGEEWIPKIEDSDAAKEIGRKLHDYGKSAAEIRINTFGAKKINHNHVRLLKIMIEEYRNYRNSVWQNQTV